MQFVQLELSEPILRALATEGYSTATPIQAQAIPHALRGRDVLGCAQTGTGKTAAFALPILHRFVTTPRAEGSPKRARALVLCPTRELASQIADSFRAYGANLKFRQTVIFGGVNQNPQVSALHRGTEVIVATPGRLLDLMDQGAVDLSGIEVLVLDEADRMLDIGFIHDIRRVVARVPKHRQTMLFSATMPPQIRQLAESLMRDPASVQVAPVSSTAEGVEQSVYHVEKGNKSALLAHLVENLPMFRAIVFTRTKHGADRVVRHLNGSGIKAEAIHGNKSQNARERALSNFRSSKIPVLVATDIASRGIDVDGITHVVNYDVSEEPETYVHRIGRTARAGSKGMAISFCSPDEAADLKAIERLIRKPIRVVEDHPQYARKPVQQAGQPRQNGGGHHVAERQPHANRQPHAPRPRPHSHQPSGSGNRPHDKPQGHGQSQHRQGQGHASRPRHPILGKGRPRNGGGGRPRHSAGRRGW
ncbi:MAG TPA: DEAD/DEAH box helicase [Tepidisphaeraceae bacterium]